MSDLLEKKKQRENLYLFQQAEEWKEENAQIDNFTRDVDIFEQRH